ncbi:MAG: D-alanyl-D-alanine endopeptidase [Burkholderiaceae bacterium]|nr:D-alanyl-D-alanine endopeptidase [Burkholderiaceae bacterium]
MLAWPVVDASAREPVQPTKRGATRAADKAKAPAVARDTRHAEGARRVPQSARGTSDRSGRTVSSRTARPAGQAGQRASRRTDVAARAGRGAARATQARYVEPAKPSLGHAIGLHAVDDPLSLQSAVALVLDQATGEVLFEKNAQAVLPIASISKLMTAMVVLDAQLPMSEMLDISQADVDTERNTRSRLSLGTRLSRGELMQLALMSSENRAAHALGRHYPGGMERFVEQMNRKAREIGMSSSHFVEPTGLSSYNVSNARDLARLVRAASDYPLIREYSTASGLTVDTGFRTVSFRNTNRLVGDPEWDIGLQKTGYLSDAGNCVVMQTRIDGRAVVLVLLDAQARWARVGDAQRIRTWLERMPGVDTGTGGVSAPGAGARKVSAQRADQLSRDS